MQQDAHRSQDRRHAVICTNRDVDDPDRQTDTDTHRERERTLDDPDRQTLTERERERERERCMHTDHHAHTSPGKPHVVHGKDLGRKGRQEKNKVVGYQRVIKDGQWDMGTFCGRDSAMCVCGWMGVWVCVCVCVRVWCG